MKSSKLWYFSEKMTKKERKRFGAFLASPFFNQKEDLERMWAALQGLRGKVSEAAFWEGLFPEEEFDANRLRKMKTALLKLIFRFWEVEAFLQDAALVELQQLKVLNERQADSFLGRYFSKEADLPEAAPFGSYLRDLEQYEYEIRTSSRFPNGALEKALRHLEADYSEQKVRLAYLGLNQKRIAGHGVEVPDLEELLTRMDREAEAFSVASRLYRHLYLGLTEELPASMTAVLALLKRVEEIPDETRKEGYAGALNFCIRQINGGQQQFRAILLQLYRGILEEGFLLEGGLLPAAHFKNVISLALDLGEGAWALDLWEGYKDRLLGDEQGSFPLYARGVIHYHEGEWEEAEHCFQRVLDDFGDIFLGLDSRVHLLRIFYETGDVDRLEALSDSFRMYLKRNPRVTEERREHYHFLIRVLRRLMQIPEHAKWKLVKLREELLEGMQIPLSPWLLQKVEEKLGE